MTARKKAEAPDLVGALRQELEHHPYRSVAIAAGLGYLLGTRAGGPLIALLGSRLGLQLASSLIAPLLDPATERS